MLNIELRNQIREYARENPKEEMCALILSSGNSTFIYKCKNISSNKEKFFEISSLDYLRAWDEGKNKIIGMVHSQRSTKPSPADVINYRNHKLPSYIYSFESDDIIEVTDKHLKYNKYLGRAFEIGASDCFTLVRDYYRQEKNILISDYARKNNWYNDNPDIIKNNYKNENFIIIDFKDIIEGNIMEFGGYHFGIYLEGDLILHHERQKFSNIERLTDVWKRRITNIYKYNE